MESTSIRAANLSANEEPSMSQNGQAISVFPWSILRKPKRDEQKQKQKRQGI